MAEFDLFASCRQTCRGGGGGVGGDKGMVGNRLYKKELLQSKMLPHPNLLKYLNSNLKPRVK